MSAEYMNRNDRRSLIEDGECKMCSDGSWPQSATTCPVCDVVLPEDEDEDDHYNH